jgi:hypothetical protein
MFAQMAILKISMALSEPGDLARVDFRILSRR